MTVTVSLLHQDCTLFSPGHSLKLYNSTDTNGNKKPKRPKSLSGASVVLSTAKAASETPVSFLDALVGAVNPQFLALYLPTGFPPGPGWRKGHSARPTVTKARTFHNTSGVSATLKMRARTNSSEIYRHYVKIMCKSLQVFFFLALLFIYEIYFSQI